MEDASRADPPAERERPQTEASYGIPDDREGLLEWRVVETTMAEERAFWVTTVRPDGRPHARPAWGVWVDGTFHCGGGERTRWVRNLSSNAAIAVHTESAESVVIIEGTAVRLDDASADAETLDRLDAAYDAKYGLPHGTPLFAVEPATVLAWTDFPTDATRWRFPD